MAVTTGTHLGRYEIRSQIGAGGMGEVYLAQDTELEREVALKVLPADAAADEQRMRRFIQEAQAASGLNHPNIITIHDILHLDGSDYMVMELVSGKTLGDVTPQGGLGHTGPPLLDSQTPIPACARIPQPGGRSPWDTIPLGERATLGEIF